MIEKHTQSNKVTPPFPLPVIITHGIRAEGCGLDTSRKVFEISPDRLVREEYQIISKGPQNELPLLFAEIRTISKDLGERKNSQILALQITAHGSLKFTL